MHLSDQVYSNTRVSTRVNTSQQESTQVNTNQHEPDTNQHESKTSLDHKNRINMAKQNPNVTYRWCFLEKYVASGICQWFKFFFSNLLSIYFL